MIQAQPTAGVKSKCHKHVKHYRSMSGVMRVYTVVKGFRLYDWKCAKCGKTGTDKQAE